MPCLVGACGTRITSVGGNDSSCAGSTTTRIALDPSTWFAGGNDPSDYAIDTSGTAPAVGSAAHIQGKVASPAGFQTLMQTTPAGPFLGKEIRFSAEVKASAIASPAWAALWFRVDGPNRQVLAFDNMQSRPIVGTHEYIKYEVVLRVASNAVDLAFGVLLTGSGEVWATEPALEVVTAGAPYAPDLAGWFASGSQVNDYSIGLDSSTPWCSNPSGGVQSSTAPASGFGTFMQTVAADEFRGTRVRYAAWVKVQEVGNGAGLWLRVDDANLNLISLDNMQNRPVKGSADFAPYDVVLDVPQQASELAFGLLLVGSGNAWIGGPTLETVGNNVPTTN
jgi:hypothetical protein